MTTMPTLDDLKWAIVKAEVHCPVHDTSLGDPYGYGCEECNGTGRVLRFPELSVECHATAWCPEPTPTRIEPVKGSAPDPCDHCHGLGKVPKDKTWEDLATWIRVLDKAVWDTGIGIPAYNTVPAILAFESPIVKGDILGALQAAVTVLGIEVRKGTETND